MGFLSRRVFVIAAKRTPFGAFGGSLKSLSANELGFHAARAALEQAPVAIDTVYFGNVAQTSNDAAYLARHVALKAGLAVTVPAVTINRLCGSGFEAAALGAMAIRAGEAATALVGGSENMSMAPYCIRESRWGTRYGKDLVAEDSLAAALVDRYPNPPVPMGITAENVAKKYGITRAHCDEYALSSQKRYAAAKAANLFANELCSVPKTGKSLDHDEHPRATTAESLAALPPVFVKNGVVTAGNASGISDGAAALVLASEEAVAKNGLKPLAEIIHAVAVGVDPSLMGLGPCPAIQMLLDRAKIKLTDIPLIEVNEAFAAQYLGVERELKLDREITNTNGGAIALGHPLAASGARILGHLCYEMQRKKLEHSIGAACIGGGQGIAVLLKNIQ